MFSGITPHEPYNLSSSLPAYPRVPSHLREWTNVSRAKADDILMAIAYGSRPTVGLADMRCIRDMTGDRTLFDIEVEEKIEGNNVLQKFHVSQYACASAYCLYLEGQPEYYLALMTYASQLNNGKVPNGAARALAALRGVTSTFPRIDRPETPPPASNLLLQQLPAEDPATHAIAAHFAPPAAPEPAATPGMHDQVQAPPTNRRQRRLALQQTRRP